MYMYTLSDHVHAQFQGILDSGDRWHGFVSNGSHLVCKLTITTVFEQNDVLAVLKATIKICPWWVCGGELISLICSLVLLLSMN